MSICRGHASIMQTHANEAVHDGGSRGWSPWCTCIFVIPVFDRHGTGLSQEPLGRSAIPFDIFSNFVYMEFVFFFCWWNIDIVFFEMFGVTWSLTRLLMLLEHWHCLRPDVRYFILVIWYYFLEDYLGSDIISCCTLKGFSSQRITQMIQFCSSVRVVSE